MGDVTLADLIDLSNKATATILLILAMVGGFRGWWVFGSIYRAKSQECDGWRSIALSQSGINKELIADLKEQQSIGRGR